MKADERSQVVSTSFFTRNSYQVVSKPSESSLETPPVSESCGKVSPSLENILRLGTRVNDEKLEKYWRSDVD
jgi:hypothetical protein